MKKEMLINVLQPEEIRIAILEDGVLEELYVERTSHESFVGNIYKGRIVNIEPSIQAAFVDFGVGRNGFLHVSDVEPAYYRHLDDNGGGGRRSSRDRGRNDRDNRGGGDRGGPSRGRAAQYADDFDDLEPAPLPVDIVGENMLESEPIDEDLLDAPLHADEERSETHPPQGDDDPLDRSWAEDEFRSVPHEAGHEPMETLEPDDEPFESEFAPPPIDDRSPRMEPRHDEFTEEENGEATDVEPAAEVTEVTEVTETIETAEATEESADEAEKPAAKKPRAKGRAPRGRGGRGRGKSTRSKAGDDAPKDDDGPKPMESAEHRTGDDSPKPKLGGDDLDELLSFSMSRPEPKPEPKKPAQPAYDEFDREPSHRSEPEAIEQEPIDDLVDEEIVSVDELTHLTYESAPIPSDADIDAAIEAGRIDEDEGIETIGPDDGDLGDDEIERVQIVELDAPGGFAPPPDDFHPGFDDQPRHDDRAPRGDRAPREDRGPRDDRGDRGPRDDRGGRGRNDRGGDRGGRNDRGDRGGRSSRGDRGPDRRGPGGPGGPGGRDRRPGPGRDQGRAGSRPGFSRPKPLIQDVFRRGQEVLVQVIKEGLGTKGPTLSTYISIAGRYLVLMPGLNRIGVSRKIDDDHVRRRLRDVMNELNPPKGLGFIIRTAGQDRDKKELQRDLMYLARLWKVVARRVRKQKSPCEIYQESDMVTRTIRDIFTADIETIWVDEQAAYESAKEFLEVVMPKYAERIKFWDKPEPMFHKHGIETEITRIQARRVELPAGGSLVIDQTEALVAIDVNSGSFRADNNNAEETAYRMNLQAAKEIARQLRLRDLGGVIVNDFIDMREERHRRNVERALHDAVGRDRARTKILRMSQFGIIQMTRQRIRPSLKRSVFHECTHCKGTGLVKTVESMSIDVMRMLQLAAHREYVHRLEVRTQDEVANYLQNKKRADISRLEIATGKAIQVRGIPGVAPEFLEFVCFDNNSHEVKFDPHEEPARQIPDRREGRGRGRGRGRDRGERGGRDRGDRGGGDRGGDRDD